MILPALRQPEEIQVLTVIIKQIHLITFDSFKNFNFLKNDHSEYLHVKGNVYIEFPVSRPDSLRNIVFGKGLPLIQHLKNSI